MGWKIRNVDDAYDAGVSVVKAEGLACASWATLGPNLKLFCINKSQQNSHTGSLSGQPCDASASLTTNHRAWYNWTGTGSVGVGPWSITLGSFGEKNVTSNAAPMTWHDQSCDPPGGSGGDWGGSGLGGGGDPSSPLSTGQIIWQPLYMPSDPYVMCERMEVHFRYPDGSVSASWYFWQCSDGTQWAE